MNKFIPYAHQSVDARDIKAVEAVLKSDWLTQGPKIPDFEEALCAYAGARYAVAVSSGTAALHIASLAAHIGNGDEVITSPITFAASANCVLYCGARPVFADVQEDTANIDPEEIEKRITAKTKAMIPVHFAGHPCDLKGVFKIAKKHDLVVIEDAAHALGAEYKGSKIGYCRYSDMTIFSFHPIKSITTGEGGAVLTNRKDLYERLLVFRNHGITKKASKSSGPWHYEMQEVGFNYRLTDIQAALGISQLKKLDLFIERRREIAGFYNKYFKDNPYFDTPVEKEYAYSAYHLYPVRIREKFKGLRKELFDRMRNKGVGLQVHYIPVYRHPYYQGLGYKAGICPIAEDFYSREISIPLYASLGKKEAGYVAKNLLGCFENKRKGVICGQ